MTTVHKKPVATTAASTSLRTAVPSLGVPSVKDAEKPFYPTNAQLKQKPRLVSLRPDSIDRRLPSAPNRRHDEYQSAGFTASDVEIYAVMAATRDNATALVLLREGIRTTEDAESFLSADEMKPLTDDRSEMATKALTRRIDAETLIEFGRLYDPALWHSGKYLDRYIDAVELYSYPKFQQKKGPVFTDILNGKIRLSDIKTIGIRTSHLVLTDSGNNLVTLHELADGSANYTAEQLRDAFKSADGNSASYSMINLMCQRHGGEWASGIDWRAGLPAQNHWRRNNRDGVGKDHAEEKAFISYADEFSKHGAPFMDDMYALFKAGVSVDYAAQEIKSRPVQQVIAMNEGIAPPVTDGWL